MRFVLIFSLLICLSGCSQRHVETIRLKGSDTEVNLVLQLAEAYMDAQPAVSVSVTGGGSGVGIAGLLNGRIDIANSSREMTGEERSLAADRQRAVVPFVFAADALAIICNPQVPVDSLNMEELGSIFSGDIQNWRQFGPSNGMISLYGRQSNSGTFTYFRERVLGRDYAPGIKQMNGNAQILEAVKADPNAIGYVGFGYLTDAAGHLWPGIKVIPLIVRQGTAAVSPLDRAAIKAGRYPLTRPLYQFTDGEPAGKIRAFYDFEKSPAGQKIIAGNGYLPATEAGLALFSQQ